MNRRGFLRAVLGATFATALTLRMATAAPTVAAGHDYTVENNEHQRFIRQSIHEAVTDRRRIIGR